MANVLIYRADNDNISKNKSAVISIELTLDDMKTFEKRISFDSNISDDKDI